MREKRGRAGLAMVACAAAIALTLLTPLAAAAVDGTGGCVDPGKFGWLATYTLGATINKPPGSQVAHSFVAGGSNSRVAIYPAPGLPKPYGVAWEATAAGTIYAATPSCQING